MSDRMEESQEELARVADICGRRDCVLVCGSGLEASLGGPTWNQIAYQLVDDSRAEYTEMDWTRVQDLVDTGRDEEVADLLTLRLPRDRLLAALWRAQGLLGTASPLTEALPSVPWAGAINLGWSDSLAAAFPVTGRRDLALHETGRLPSLLHEDSFFVLHARGSMADSSTVFATAELRSALSANSTLRRVLSALFRAKSWFFVGVSLDSIWTFLSNAIPASSKGRAHFVLLPGAERDALKEERLRRMFGLNAIEIPTVNEAPGAIRRIASKAPVTGTHEPSGPAIGGVRLHNIGPFTDLSVEIRGFWTVLLGDNGSGKSSVLKAIALALSGDDNFAQILGGTLLKAGAPSGYIELAIGDDVLRTDLVQDGTRVRVVASGVSPLQAGTMLALGFPPVRGATQQRAGRRTEPSRSSDPGVDDVLPLVRSPIDWRLGQLRDWIQTVDAQLDGAVHVGALFDVLKEVSPGLQYTFDSVTAEGDVLVRTQDGVLPVERLSQGAVSLMTWLGTLVRRQLEIDPERQPADWRGLVLVDEIDAHLHPEWQRRIVGLLAGLFPRLTFVVSTHSPLVVGSAEDGTLLRLERTDGHPHIECIEIDFTGWRADQILTSIAFDLPSSRDPETAAKIERFRELNAEPDPTEAEGVELVGLRAELADLLPGPHETAVDRDAMGLLEQFAEARLMSRSVEHREAVLTRLRQLVDTRADPPA